MKSAKLIEIKNSSQIASVAYNDNDKELFVVFKSNSEGIYSYKNVPRHMFDELLNASSVGSYFIQNIKKYPDIYPFVKMIIGKEFQEIQFAKLTQEDFDSMLEASLKREADKCTEIEFDF